MESIDLNAIAKGKLSLADALKQIETVTTAFKRAENIEKKLSYHDSLLTEMKNSMLTYVTTAFMSSKFEEFSNRFTSMIGSKFEEFSSQFMFQLNEKANTSDVESLVSQRVTWITFNNYSQQINALKARLDKHILSDFEGFKTKVKLELSHKADEKKADEDVNIEEIHQIKNRLTSLEQKYHDMFLEEGLDDSEDYDSQEAMDNMIEDIEKNGIKDKASDEGGEGDQDQEEFQEIGRKLNIPLSSLNASPEAPKSQFSGVSPIFQTPLPATSPEIVSPRSDNFDTAKTEVSDEPAKTQSKAEVLPAPEQSKSTEYQRIPLEHQVSEKKQPENVESFVENALNSKPKSRSSIEIDNPEPNTPKYHRGKASSRADNQTLTRKNSMASSMGGNLNGAGGGVNSGMRQLNKKVIALQKDIENDKTAIDEAKENLMQHDQEFEKTYQIIEDVKKRIEEVETKRQGMEMSFIKALRRNGIDKKNNKGKQKPVGMLDAEQMLKIQEQISRKTKKIKSISTYVEKIAADTWHMKEKQNTKINEIIKSLKHLDDSRANVNKQLVTIADSIKNIENECKNSISNVKSEFRTIQGPLTDLISDQQRENQMLNQDIRKQHMLLNEVIQDFKINKQSRAESNQTKMHVNTLGSESPKLSVKHRASNYTQGFRRNSLSTQHNWLEQVPDGVSLVLPRISAPVSTSFDRQSL